MTSSEDSKVLENIGISVGQKITHTSAGYMCQNNILQISEELSDRIILRCISEE